MKHIAYFIYAALAWGRGLFYHWPDRPQAKGRSLVSCSLQDRGAARMMCVRHGWQPYCYQRTPGGGRSRLFITGMTEGGVLDPWPQSKLDYHCQVKNTLERMMAQTDPTVHNMAVALAVAVDRMVKAYDDEQDGLYHRATQGMHTDLVNILREKLEAAEQDERNSEEYLTGFADALSLAEDPYDEPDMADAGGY